MQSLPFLSRFWSKLKFRERKNMKMTKLNETIVNSIVSQFRLWSYRSAATNTVTHPTHHMIVNEPLYLEQCINEYNVFPIAFYFQ